MFPKRFLCLYSKLIAGKSLCMEINLVQERLDYDIGDNPSTVGNIFIRLTSLFYQFLMIVFHLFVELLVIVILCFSCYSKLFTMLFLLWETEYPRDTCAIWKSQAVYGRKGKVWLLICISREVGGCLRLFNDSDLDL